MYGVLYTLSRKYKGVKGGFIHVPFIPEQTVDKPDKPSMHLGDIVRGLEAAIKAIVENEIDIKVTGGLEH